MKTSIASLFTALTLGLHVGAVWVENGQSRGLAVSADEKLEPGSRDLRTGRHLSSGKGKGKGTTTSKSSKTSSGKGKGGRAGTRIFMGNEPIRHLFEEHDEEQLNEELDEIVDEDELKPTKPRRQIDVGAAVVAVSEKKVVGSNGDLREKRRTGRYLSSGKGKGKGSTTKSSKTSSGKGKGKGTSTSKSSKTSSGKGKGSTSKSSKTSSGKGKGHRAGDRVYMGTQSRDGSVRHLFDEDEIEAELNPEKVVRRRRIDP